MELRNRLTQFIHDLTLFIGALGYVALLLFYFGMYQFMIQKVGTSSALVVNAVTFEEMSNSITDRVVNSQMGKRR